MREQDVQTKIKKYLEGQGEVYVVKVIQATKAGVSDLLVCYRGLFIAIEVKTPKTKNKISDLQKYNIDKVREAGGIAVVLCDVGEVKKLLKDIDETFGTTLQRKQKKLSSLDFTKYIL